MQDQWIRTRMLLGGAAMKRLRESTVAVFGLGGVGGAVVEALARSGVGRLVLVDHDRVSLSNLNAKSWRCTATLARERWMRPAPAFRRSTPAFVSRGTIASICRARGARCWRAAIMWWTPSIRWPPSLPSLRRRGGGEFPSSAPWARGTNWTPSNLRSPPLKRPAVCPLCRVMRRELKKRGLEGTRVLYSREIPLEPEAEGLPSGELKGGRVPPGSTAFVPPVAGYLIASAVVRDLIGAEEVE